MYKKVKEFIKKNKRKIFRLAGVIGLILIVSIDINEVFSRYFWFNNLKDNLKLMAKAVIMFYPVLIILVIYFVYKVLNKKWVFRVEKLSLGGFNIIFDNPEQLFKQHVRNFLNTKRTLFKIDEDKDNFYETLNSYYSIYNFIRDEMKLFDPKTSKKSESYKTANLMIQELNDFLTKHQNNFRRWYEYIMDKDISKNFDKDIGLIQKEYRNYDLIVKDFKDLNNFFCDISDKFEIDATKWNI
jgi:hypothetical protein